MPHESTFLDVFLNREQFVAYQLYGCQVQQQLLVCLKLEPLFVFTRQVKP